MHPLPSPKPFMSAPKYYHSARPGNGPMRSPAAAQTYSTAHRLLDEEEAGQEGDAEDDGDEGSSTGVKRKEVSRRPSGDKPAIGVPTALSTGRSASTGELSADGNSQELSEDADEEEDEEDDDDEEDGDEEEDYSKDPGLMNLLDISFPSIREEELLRAVESHGTQQGWLDDNDYSFSSLLGHLDMHLNVAANEAGAPVSSEGVRRAGGNQGSENGSTTGVSEEEEAAASPEKRPLVVVRSTNDMLSDRCSIISESSVDFVKKFAEMAGMIQDH